MARDRGLRVEVVVGEEVTTLGGHLLALFVDRQIRPYRSLRATIAAVHEAGGLAIPAHPLVPYPLCAQGWVLRRLLDDPDPARSAGRARDVQPHDARPAGAQARDPVRGRARAGAPRQQRCPCARRDRVRLDDLPRPRRRRPAPGDRGPDDRARRHLPPDRRAARDVRPAAPQAWPGREGRARRARCAATAPVATTGTPAAGCDRPASSRPGADDAAADVKIGLVCPYIYPESGGVAQHVRFLYENLRLRGHDVRIITASHGPQRASEGDILRIGVGFSMPTNGSVGTLTFSPRYIVQVQQLLERERFDLLHFHEPFVPFLSLFLLRESHSVNVATFHAYAGFSPSYELGSRVMGGYAERLHGRIAVSAAARHFIDRFFPGDYKVIPNGVDVPRFASAVPLARWQDGTPNVLFVGRHEPRKGLLDLLKAHRILRKTGAGNRLLVVGSGPQEREARRYVATRGLQEVEFLGRVSDDREGAALPDGRRLRGAGDRARIVRDRAARGDGRRRADRRLGHPRLQGRRPPRPRGIAGPAARAQGAGRGDRPAAGRPGAARADGRGRPASAPRSSAGRGSPRGSRSTTASSSAGWRPRGSLPDDFRAPRPSGAAGQDPSVVVRVGRRTTPCESASATRQTQAE